jgi:hypothetical protein
MSRRHQLRRFLNVRSLEDRLAPAVVLWQGNAVLGDPNAWSNPLNWAGGLAPLTTDTAKFDTNNVPVNVDTAETVAGIILTTNWSSSFNVATTLNTTGASTWSNSSISGAGAWNNSGTVAIDTNTVTINGITLSNTGTFNLTTSNNINCGSSAVINNNASGIFDIHTDGNIIYAFGGEQTINNAGIIRKSGGTSSTVVQAIINNQGGTWDSQSSGGTLRMESDGGVHTGGTFKASAGAFLDVNNGATATWKGNYTGSGAGTVYENSGIISIDAAGATFNFPSGLYEWDGGQMTGTGKLTNASTGFITLNGGTPTLNGLTFSNAGTITHKTGNNVNAGNGAVFTNETTGVYDFQTDGDFINAFGAEPTFNNKGLIKKTVGTGDTVINAIINNQGGTWNAMTGVLHMQSDGGVHTGGTFLASSMASVDVTGGSNATWKGNYTGSGAGIVDQSNGTITVDATGATFNFPSNYYEWDGGVITGGTLSNTGTIRLNGGTPQINAGTISNSGIFTHTTGNNLQLVNAAQFQNSISGVYNFQGDGSIVWAAGSEPTVTNAGLIRKTGGVGTSGIDGAVSVPGGTWESISGTLGLRSFSQTHTGGIFQATSPGVVNLTDGVAAYWKGSYTASGTGTVGIFDATTMDAAGATFNFPAATPLHWSSGSINGGPFTNASTGFIVVDSNTFAVNGSTVINQGTITHTTSNSLQLNSGAQFQNTATGVYDFQADGSIINAGGALDTLTNSGLIRKSGGTAGGTSLVDGAVSVPGGIWQSLVGTLSLRSFGQTHTGGTFEATAPATLNMTGGVSANWKGTFTGSGTGTVGIFDATTIDAMGATFNFPNATPLHWSAGSITGGTFANTGFILVDGNTFAVNGSTVINQGTFTHTTTNNLQLNSGAQFQNTATGVYLFQNDGSIFNAGGALDTLTNNGLIRKTGGTNTSLVDGAVSTPNGVWESLSGTLGLRSFGQTHTGGTFKATSPGVVNLTEGVNADWQGTFTGSGTGTIGIFDSTTIDAAGATFNFPTATPLHWSSGAISGGVLTNTGFILIDSGTVAVNGSTIINQGTVTQTTNNNLQLNSAAQFQNTATGLYDFQSDGSIFNAGGSTDILTNNGLIRKSGGTAGGTSLCDGAVSVPGGTWESQIGTLGLRSFGQTHTGGLFKASAGATVNLTEGVNANWKGGSYISSGAGTIGFFDSTTIDAAGASFNFPASTPLHWSSGAISGGTMTNLGFMVIDSGTVAVAGNVLDNEGTITHTTANNLQLNSGAQMTNGPSALYLFQGDGSIVNFGSVSTLTNGGLIRKAAGTGTSSIQSNFTSSGGFIDVQTGTIQLPSTYVPHQGGLLGKGTLANSVQNDDGFVRPGPISGVLTVNGNYSQGPTALFVPEMKGTTAADFTQMQVNGTTTLGGILQPIVNYNAKVNDSFVVLHSIGAITGSFSNAASGGSVTVNGTTFSVTYPSGASGDVVLKVTAVTPGIMTPPKVLFVAPNGGGVQRSRVTSLLVQFDQAVVQAGTTAAAFQLKRQSDSASVVLGGFDPGFFNSRFSKFGISPIPIDFATLTFIGGPTDFGSLADGRYTLTIQASQITSANGQLDGNGDGTGGDNYVQVGAPGSGSNLFRMYGDINGDGTVSAADFIQFRQAFGGSSFAFDFDGDGAVAASDFIQFRLRFGGSI